MGPYSGEPVTLTRADIERFLAHVDKTDGCWEWKGSRTRGGTYGQMNLKRRPVGAHRISYRIHVGEIPRGMCVLHECDNPPCVNPEHLKLGTHQDNMIDRSARGRYRNGWKERTHCQRGHVYGPPDSDGHRACKECLLEWQRRAFAERREQWQRRAAEVLAPYVPTDINELLKLVTFREATFIRGYFGLAGCSLTDLTTMAALWGITRERVRQIRNRGLEKLGTSINAIEAQTGTYSNIIAA